MTKFAAFSLLIFIQIHFLAHANANYCEINNTNCLNECIKLINKPIFNECTRRCKSERVICEDKERIAESQRAADEHQRAADEHQRAADEAQRFRRASSARIGLAVSGSVIVASAVVGGILIGIDGKDAGSACSYPGAGSNTPCRYNLGNTGVLTLGIGVGAGLIGGGIAGLFLWLNRPKHVESEATPPGAAR